MVRKPDRPMITFGAHHRQGISLSVYFETRIDFEKTCGSDRFCNSVPRKKQIAKAICFFQLNPPLAEEIHLWWMKSLRDEIPLRGEKDAADLISSEAVRRRFHPNKVRISSWQRHDFIDNLPFLCYNKPGKTVEI